MNNENLKPFKPGEDPRRNVTGENRKLPGIDELLFDVLSKEVRGKSEATNILIAAVKKAKKGDIKAAEFLISYYYGKATQGVKLSGEVTARIIIEDAKNCQPLINPIDESNPGI